MPQVLFGESEIAAQVARVAREIATSDPRVELVVPILVGAFVFAADLLRALAREAVNPEVEFLQLSRYGAARAGRDEIAIRLGASERVAGRSVLLVDGVLDEGHTLSKAREIVRAAGARAVRIAVAVDKSRRDALVGADHAAFRNVEAFIVGYGMDDAGAYRGLPFIGRVA